MLQADSIEEETFGASKVNAQLKWSMELLHLIDNLFANFIYYFNSITSCSGQKGRKLLIKMAF